MITERLADVGPEHAAAFQPSTVSSRMDMNRHWITQQRAMLLVMVGLFICSQLSTVMTQRLTAVPANLLATVTQPFSDRLNQLTLAVIGADDSSHTNENYDTLVYNYERAVQDNEWLRQELLQSYQLIEELSQVRQNRELGDKRLPMGTVTSQSADRRSPMLTINIGTRQGVRPGQVVAHGYHLVGQVAEAGALVSRVALITRPQRNLTVSIRPQSPEAITDEIRAMIEVDDDGRRFHTQVGVADEVEVGDLAFLADESWPVEARGFVVGAVTQIRPMETDPQLRREVIIEPIRDLRYVRRVFVVVPADLEVRE